MGWGISVFVFFRLMIEAKETIEGAKEGEMTCCFLVYANAMIVGIDDHTIVSTFYSILLIMFSFSSNARTLALQKRTETSLHFTETISLNNVSTPKNQNTIKKYWIRYWKPQNFVIGN